MLLVDMFKSPVHIFIPCHNRSDLTFEFFCHLNSVLLNKCDYLVHLIDDGSVDGTSENILEKWPSTLIHKLDGTAFWGGSLNYICEYVRNSLPLYPDPLILIANDDIRFHPNSIENALNIMSNGFLDILIPVVLELPELYWNSTDILENCPISLQREYNFAVNYGDHYSSISNKFSRLSCAGDTNLGVTSAIFLFGSTLIDCDAVPAGLPHYASDFWLTISLHLKGYHLATCYDYFIFRRLTSTRPSSRQFGRFNYWRSCCNPSSPDYLASSVIFQLRFSSHKAKFIHIFVLTFKFLVFSSLFRSKHQPAQLALSPFRLLLLLLVG